MYDEERSFFGVSICMLFNNLEGLSLTNMTLGNCAGFAVQAEDLKNARFENITFEEFYADGLHINGNSENIFIKNIREQAGDDLVALNMYDWQDFSVNFGPAKNILCKNLELWADSPYKALRIVPGVYCYAGGSSVDCFVNDVIIKNVKGINTFKMYLQTPQYPIGGEPEKDSADSGGNIFFENIDVDLNEPVDKLGGYLKSDLITGSFAAFEIGANIRNLSLGNICIKLYKEKYPMSFLVCVGPKSVCENGIEIFDPDLSSTVEEIEFKNIFVNGKKVIEPDGIVYEIVFKNLYPEVKNDSEGKILSMNFKK